MIRIIILLFLASPLTSLSQHFIGKSRSQVKKELQKKIDNNDSLTITLHDNDSTVVFSYKAGTMQQVDFIYGFSKAGKCWSEKFVLIVIPVIKNTLPPYWPKKYEWKKINENQYISKYSDQLMIELPGNDKDFSYTILHTEWSKELYDMLKSN